MTEEILEKMIETSNLYFMFINKYNKIYTKIKNDAIKCEKHDITTHELLFRYYTGAFEANSEDVEKEENNKNNAFEHLKYIEDIFNSINSYKKEVVRIYKDSLSSQIPKTNEIQLFIDKIDFINSNYKRPIFYKK